MRATVTVTLKGEPSPFIARPGLGFGTDASTPNFNSKNIWRAFIAILKAVITSGLWTRDAERPVLRASTANARGIVTTATVVNANTIAINGTTLTAAAHRSHQTVQFTTAVAGNTVTINGVTFTGATGAVVHGAATFSVDTGDTATAASFADQVNYYTATDTLVLAKSATDTVTLFAKLEPVTAAQATATDAYTLTAVGVPITLGGATFTGGAAAVNNEFDYIGNNATTAASIAANIALSSTALVSKSVVANNQSAIVTCTSVAASDTLNLRGETLIACVAATNSSYVAGNRTVTAPPNLFAIGSTDTECGTSLCNCINFHPRLRELYYADNVAGAVTIHERSPTLGSGSYVVSGASTMVVTATDPLRGGGVFGSNASCLIEAIDSGTCGNAVTVAGTVSTLVFTGSITRLAGGTSVISTF